MFLSFWAFFIASLLWSFGVVRGLFDPLDQAIYLKAMAVASEPFLRFWYSVTLLGNGEVLLFLTGAIVFFLLRKRYFKEGCWFLGQMIVVLSLNRLLKNIFARARPESFDVEIILKSLSYPSGHTLGAVIFYVFALWILTKLTPRFNNRLIQIGGGILIALIGLSRIFLGVHWFSDVLGAYLIGGVWIFLNFLWARHQKFFQSA